MNTTGKGSLLGPQDLAWPDILELDRKFFPRPWSTKDWESLDFSHHHVLAWKFSEQTVGYALFSFLPGDDTAHLLKICLDPGQRGRGIAQEFWSEMAQWLRKEKIEKVFLEVEEPNLTAIGFYQKVGFRELRKVKGYYSDGVNGLMMLLTL